MRVGGFWGLTAPMLLLVSPEQKQLSKLFQTLNNTMNRSILEDLKAELVVLHRLQDFADVAFEIDESEMITKSVSSSVMVQDGLIIGTSLDQEIAQIQFENEMLLLLVEMIVQGERKGKFVKYTEVNQLSDALRQALQGQTFPMLKVRSFVRGVYKGMIVEQGSPLSQAVLRELGVKFVMPKTVLVDNKIVEVSQNAQKVCNYYLQRMEFCEQVYKLIDTSALQEERVFNISFFDLVKRKPESMLYQVISRFDFIKTKQNASVIKNVIAEVRQEITTYRECLGKYVDTFISKNSADVMDAIKYRDYIESFDEKKGRFFTSLQYRSALHITDLLESDFQMLSNLYDRIYNLDYSRLNSTFGVDCSAYEWEDLIKELCSLGVYGINLHSLDLFEESISTISLISSNKILKSQEDLDAINEVLDTIESLVNTLKPIGEVLNV